MRFGLDYAGGPLTPAQHKAIGSSFACRYLSHDDSKNLGKTEAALLMAGGVDIVSVWETTAARALDGRGAGAQDARDALNQARVKGIPAGRPIFFAVDFDAQPAHMAAIHQYFWGIHDVLDNAGPVSFPQPVPVGVYGGIAVVSSLLNVNLVAYAWQTYAWSHGHLDSRAGLYQFSNGHTVSGVGVDYNRALKADFGNWGYHAPAPKPKPTMHYERYDSESRSYCSNTNERRLAQRYDELRKAKGNHKAELATLRRHLECHTLRLRSVMIDNQVDCKKGTNDKFHWCWRHYRLGRRADGKTVKPDKR